MEIAFVLTLLAAALVLFARETFPVDIVTLLALLALMMAGVLTPQEAFAGFGSEIIIILASVFIISGALRETGVVDWLGGALDRVAQGGEASFLVKMVLSVSSLSAFMNNTTVAAILLAPVASIARRRKWSPSKLLMPMAFAAILGGTCTLIGTSTNVAVSGYMARAGLAPLGFFELTPVGVLIVTIGTAYLALLGRHLLPDNPTVDLAEDYGLREYLSEILIKEESPLSGQQIQHSDLGQLGFRILKVLRDGKPRAPRPDLVLAAGDVLIVNGPVESLMKVRETEGIEIRPDVAFGEKELKADELEILEVLVTPESFLRGRRLESLELPRRLGIVVLAVNRHGRRLRDKLKTVRLETGDLLLVQGARASMDALRASPDFAIFGEQNPAAHRGKKGLLVIAFFLFGVAVSSAGFLPLSAGLLAAAVAAVLLRCMPIHKVYSCVEWRVLVLIAGMMAFGLAMEKTKAAEWLADIIVMTMSPFGGTVVFAGFVVLTILLTQPMSNAAAALVVLPVALSTAEKLGLNGRSFAIGVTLAASVSLIAPFEPASLLVYGPGKYRFVDFLRVGGLLTLIMAALVIAVVPVFWPLLKPS
jgi:di/tricarboxylate transporter